MKVLRETWKTRRNPDEWGRKLSGHIFCDITRAREIECIRGCQTSSRGRRQKGSSERERANKSPAARAAEEENRFGYLAEGK